VSEKARFVNVVLVHDGVVDYQWLYPYEREDEAKKKFVETAENLHGEKFSEARKTEILADGFFETKRYLRPKCVCIDYPETM